jgi:RNA polymerase sigma factor (sigma-70 family)
VQDGEIVAAILAGDPAGIAAAYDNYAPALYGYCRTLLSEPADAAEAVLDTYLVAMVKLDGLRDPDRLRPWLYAVARNECFRRLRAQGLSAPLATAVAVTPTEPDPALGPEREEMRDLVVDALSGLEPGDREVIELNLRHVLDGDDLADALGISRKQAHALLLRARAQFEGSLGALLAARTGGECEELEDILAGWDGERAGVLRKRVNRHLDNCDVCGERERRELSAAMLLSMLPMVAIPASLREQVLRMAGDLSPAADRQRALVARRAEPFDRSGFPEPVAASRRVYGVPAVTIAACAAVAAAVLLGAGTVLTLGALHHKGPAASAATVGPAAVAQPPLSADTHQAVTPSPSKSGSRGGKQHIGLTITASGSPSPTPPQSGQAGQGQPSPRSSSPTPGRTHPSPSPSQSPSPSPGTLAVSPGSVTLSSIGATASFTITASGGTVSYSIADPAPAGDLTVSPAAGTLSAGQSATVSVTVVSDTGLASETDLTVTPGGLTVAVLYTGAG